jgi:hypothetical protein
MLQALTDFSAYVDGRSGNRKDKDALKAAGATLSDAALDEAVDHAVEHLDAAVVDNPSDTQLAARVAQMKKYLTSARPV